MSCILTVDTSSHFSYFAYSKSYPFIYQFDKVYLLVTLPTYTFVSWNFFFPCPIYFLRIHYLSLDIRLAQNQAMHFFSILLPLYLLTTAANSAPADKTPTEKIKTYQTFVEGQFSLVDSPRGLSRTPTGPDGKQVTEFTINKEDQYIRIHGHKLQDQR